MNKRILCVAILVLSLLVLAPASAQSTKGVLSGVVKDAVGAVLQGAKNEL